jgi:hypothetical protein
MRLLDTYATNTGSTIDKPFIFSKYFPLPVDKYITLQTQTPYDSRNYDYWQDVIDILNPILNNYNINIAHTGLKEDKKYNGVISLLGQTTINQLAYIIENSLLHFGADSFGVHLASHYNKPIISLYSISNPSVAGPHFGDSKKHVLIKTYENIGNKKPSYSQVENPKSINTVNPELIAQHVLNLLNIKHVIDHKTTFIGQKYGNILLEAIPSIILQNNIFAGIPLNIRFDYIDNIEEKDYICTLNNLNVRKCAIIVDKPIEIEKLVQQKDQIINLFYDITFKDIDLNFVHKIKLLGIKVDFIFNKSKNKNQSILDNKKLELIDYQEIIHIVENTDRPIEKIKESKFYKSKKILFANNNSYLSKAAYLENKPINLEKLDFIQAIDDIKNIDLLIEEDSDYCLFYK